MLGLHRARVSIPLVAAVVTLAALSGVAWVARTAVRHAIFDQVDEELDTLVDAIGSDIELRGLQDLRSDALRAGLESNVFEFRLAHHSAILYRGEEELERTGDLPRQVAAAQLVALDGRDGRPFTAVEQFTGQGRVCRFEVARLAGLATGTSLVVFRSIEETLRFLDALDRALVALVALGALLCGLILVLATRQALLPVERMTAAARVISGHDLTRRVPESGSLELRRLAGVLNGLLERLERAFTAQRRLAADAAHELKTPLAVIVAETQDALRREASAGERERSLRTVLDSAQGLATGIDDLVELTRSGTGALSERSPVDLAEVVEDAVLVTARLASTRRMTVRFERGGELRLDGDRRGLERMVTNLLRNALQYSPEGSEVEVEVGSAAGGAWVEVRDRGPGIPAADREQVFERFVRLPAGRAANPLGSGLGLAIVAEVAQGHGGRVGVGDRPGGGSVIRVDLPLG